ncbi:MAG: cyclic pyranopterin monophosphate synthase MoaC [Lachnospiraceae bacterium]|nr:cyclic pyranopterin monophosphate synthase MoaC [Lachnospiraceae bacterium]
MDGFTHIDEKGKARMVDVTDKEPTKRRAVAQGVITLNEAAYEAVTKGSVPKGDVFAAARIAGIMAAKKTPELIPLCHPLSLTGITLDIDKRDEDRSLTCICEVTLTGKTGAEMEALTGVSTALLTIYDMCKALDKGMEIGEIKLLEKEGGKSGHYISS